MTTQHAPVAGDVVADRYRLLARLGRDPAAERYRARDQRLQRDVLLEIGLQPGVADVRGLAGADDTGMHSVLDGGAVEGRTFVVRELAGSAYDETAPIEVGESTAVMEVPAWASLPVLPAAPAPGRPTRRRVPRAGAWLIGVAAVVLLALALVAWGGSGTLDPADVTTTTVHQVEASSRGKGATAQTTPTTAPTTTQAPTTTEAPTTTAPGFPFDDGGPRPPGHEKKQGGG